MNDKTYADGIDASCICEGKFATDDGHAVNCPAGINYQAWQDRTVLTNTSEAIAIGANNKLCDCCGTHEVSLERTCHNSDCAKYAEPVTVYEGWKEPASPKPDTNTSVDPGVAGVRAALFNAFRAVWFNGRGTVGSYDSEAVEAFWNYHVELVLATIDHPIARSGMGIGETIEQRRAVYRQKIERASDEETFLNRYTPVDAWQLNIETLDWLESALSPQQDQSR